MTDERRHAPAYVYHAGIGRWSVECDCGERTAPVFASLDAASASHREQHVARLVGSSGQGRA